MRMTRVEEWVTESKPADETRRDEEDEDEDACKIDPGDQVSLEDEIVKNQQSLEDQVTEDQMEETSEGNITEVQTKMISEDKASDSYSFSDVLSIWQWLILFSSSPFGPDLFCLAGREDI